MRVFIGFIAALSFLAVSSLAHAADITAPRPGESPRDRAIRILEYVDDLWRGDSSRGTFEMRVQTENYTRTMKMSAWTKGKDNSLVVIDYPLKEKGTATLKAGNTVYTYLPKTDRTIKITSSMMMGSWMGSHFTNDDLVKESRLSDDYDPSITFEGVKDGLKQAEFTLIPKPDAAVVWGKIVTSVRGEDLIPIVSVYYDEDLRPVRTMYFNDIKTIGGRKLAARMKVVPMDKPAEFTEIIYHDIVFNPSIDDSVFSISEIQRIGR